MQTGEVIQLIMRKKKFNRKAIRVGIIGTRGIPANYGGFETFAEQLAIRLVEKGYEVTVYGRSNNVKYNGKTYNGVNLVILPTIKHKYLDTVFNTFLSVWHASFKKYDVILVCNSINSIFTIIPRIFGKKIALNVDGLEWKRKKWKKIGKIAYRLSEYLATIFADEIVTDARVIKIYYKKKFGKESTFIPYGGRLDNITTNDILATFKLKVREYILYVSRLEPENNAHIVIKAFENVKTDMKLVIVGDAPYNSDYIKNLKKTSDSRIIFTGYIFGDAYKELQANAYLYIQATEVGGTHPALLEAMGFGNCVIANDVPEHREVLLDAGMYYEQNNYNSLSNKIQYLIENPIIVAQYGERAKNRIKQNYTWDRIAEQYDKLFLEMIKNNF